MDGTPKSSDRGRRVELSVVIPIYNEEIDLTDNLMVIKKYVDSATTDNEFILIDDGSRDGTWSILEDIAKQIGRTTVIRFSRNFGKESAILAGMDIAVGNAVLVMDVDLQHTPEIIPQMVSAWKEEGVDIVESVKVFTGAAPKLWNKLFYMVMRRLTGFDMKNSCDFKLLDRRVVDIYLRMPERTRFFRGLTLWTGLRRIEISMPLKGRRSGKSKWSKHKLFRLGADAIVSFSAVPLQLITVMGGVTLLLSIVLTVFSLYMKLSGKALTGFSTVIILILLIGSVLMISLGIIGLYLSKIYDEIKSRPAYIIDEIIDNRGHTDRSSSS